MLAVLVILYRLFILIVRGLRPYFLQARCRLSSSKDLAVICKSGNIGDWFLFYMLGTNLDPIIMREITHELAKRLDKDSTRSNLAERMNIIAEKVYA